MAMTVVDYYGHVASVDARYHGSELDALAAIGTKILSVHMADEWPDPDDPDVETFVELVDDNDLSVVYEAADVDADNDIITLVNNLAETWPDGTTVRVWPLVYEVTAEVHLDGVMDEETQPAIIQDSNMQDLLTPGVRDAGTGEYVRMQYEGDDLIIKEVLGEELERDLSTADASGLTTTPPEYDGLAPPDPASAPLASRSLGMVIADMKDYNITDDHLAFLPEYSTDGGTNWIPMGETGSKTFRRTDDYDTAHIFRYRVLDREGLISGYSPASESVTARRVNEGGATDIDVDSVTADMLDSVIALVSLITSSKTGTGQRWEADEDGIRVYDENGSPLVDLPATAGLRPFFRAAIEAIGGLTVSTMSSFRDIAQFEPGAAVELKASQSDPSSAPTIDVEWDKTTFNYSPVGGGADLPAMRNPRGLGRNPATGNFFIVEQVGGGYCYEFNGSGQVIRRISLHPGAGVVPPYYPSGVAIASGFLFTLQYEPDSSNFTLHKRNISDGVIVGTKSVTAIGFNDPNALGTDGTDVWVAGRYLDFITGPAQVSFRKILATTLAYSGVAILTNYTPDLVTYPASLDVRNVGDGVTRMYMAMDNGTTIRCFETTGTRDSAREFTVPEVSKGIVYDTALARVRTLRGGTGINIHTNWTDVTAVDYSYTWYQTAPIYESKASPVKNIVPKRRAGVRISWPSKPVGVNRVRLYGKVGATTYRLTSGSFGDGYGVTIDTVFISARPADMGTVNAPPGVSTFPVVTPSKVFGQNGLQLRGDGHFSLGRFAADPAIADLGGGQMFWRSDVGRLRWWNDIMARYESPVVAMDANENFVTTSEVRTNVAFGNLTTVGPTVWIKAPISGRVMMMYSARMKTATGGNSARAAPQILHVTGDASNVTGTEGEKLAATEGNSIDTQVAQLTTCARPNIFAGLTPGEWYRVQLKYNTTSAVQGTFDNRQLVVVPL